MGTGLIYVAIVAAWAAYLVPLLIRRHEGEVAAEPSMDPAAPAHNGPGARVLARRPPAQRSSVGQGSSVGQDGSPSVVRTDSSERPGPSPAVRRRRILLGLVALTAATGVLSLLGLATWWSLSLPSAAVVVFLSSSVRVARSRRNVRAERRWVAQPVPAARRYSQGSGRDATPGSTVSHGPIPSARTARVDSGRAEAPVPATATSRAASDSTSAGTKSAVEAGSATDARVGTGSDDTTGSASATRDEGWWDPVQVPLPTYVTKAKASRTVRTVDLGVPGTWTAGRLPESEMLVRPDDSPAMLLDETESDPPGRASDQDAAADADTEGSEHRRAVGD